MSRRAEIRYLAKGERAFLSAGALYLLALGTVLAATSDRDPPMPAREVAAWGLTWAAFASAIFFLLEVTFPRKVRV